MSAGLFFIPEHRHREVFIIILALLFSQDNLICRIRQCQGMVLVGRLAPVFSVKKR